MARKAIFGHKFFSYNSATFGLKYFVGAWDTIIYRFIMRNEDYETYFSIFNFWPTFGGKMVSGHHAGPLWPGALNLTKKLAHWVDLSGYLLSRKYVFKIFELYPLPALFEIGGIRNIKQSKRFLKVEICSFLERGRLYHFQHVAQ